MSEIAILSSGMVSSVGLNAPASCAAIRCAVTGFTETRFIFAGEWILGAEVPLDQPWTGRVKLLEMAVQAISECLENDPELAIKDIPLLLCLPERDRPGRINGLDATFFNEVQARIGEVLHPDSALISGGRIGGVKAIEYARDLIADGQAGCLLAGVDSLLVAASLNTYDEQRWLLTEDNSDGFIPGEAACAVLLGKPKSGSDLRIMGLGRGQEPAPLDSEQPLRGQGLSEAIGNAMEDADVDFAQIEYRICDANGIQYFFKEAALALARTIRPVKPEFEVWHVADCIGEVGAATVFAALITAEAAHRKHYSPSMGVLCHFASFDEERAALVLGTGKGAA